MLAIIDAGLLRVGNEQSAEQGHYGATTLVADHLDDDGHLVLEYIAKSGKERAVVIEDEQLADIIVELADTDTDTERLFWFRDEDGEQREITAAVVNATIAAVAGSAFTAKDLRTWGGSRVVLEARVAGLGTVASLDAVAESLGNTRAVARASYVHPDVMSADDARVYAVWRSSRRSTTMSRADRALLKLLHPPRRTDRLPRAGRDTCPPASSITRRHHHGQHAPSNRPKHQC